MMIYFSFCLRTLQLLIIWDGQLYMQLHFMVDLAVCRYGISEFMVHIDLVTLRI